MASIEQAPRLALALAVLVAAGLIGVPRVWRSVLLTPALVVAGSLVFYAALALSGLNLEQARAEGMLMAPLASASSPPAAIVKGLPLVRWDVLAGEWHHLAIIAVVVLIAVPLNTASIEVETGQDADFDREFRVSGIANVVAGIVGGMPGYASVSRTSLNFKAGATSRAAGIWCGLLILAVTFAFTPVLTYLPKPVLAGLLVALSYGMVREWLWDSFFRLPLSEYVLILAITALIVGPGLVPGFGFGILASTVLFVYRYGRARHVRHGFSASQHSSNKERPVPHIASLRRRGEAARVLSLQGYLFFGSAIGIVDSCRQLIEREGVQYLLLDFRLVEGIDISASSAFAKLYQVCRRRSGQLLLTGLGEPVRHLLDRTGLLALPGLHVLPDLDRGLEWIEDQLLAGDPLPAEAGGCDSDLHVLLQQNLTAEALDVVLNMCNTISFSPGEALFRRNDPGDSLYLIERGQVSVMLPFEDGQPARLGSSGAGTVVGEGAVHAAAALRRRHRRHHLPGPPAYTRRAGHDAARLPGRGAPVPQVDREDPGWSAGSRQQPSQGPVVGVWRAVAAGPSVP